MVDSRRLLAASLLLLALALGVVSTDVVGLDGDGVAAIQEWQDGTDPLDSDTDGDGLGDGAERDRETDPTNPDTDGDGLADGREVDLGTSPTTADTDGDRLEDGAEVRVGTDPTVADTDGDGLEDGPERNRFQTDPLDGDTDGEGLADGPEVERYDTDPTNADTDGDGLDDAEEVARGTDPTAADTDGDSLADARELEAGTDPTRADTDDDSLADGRELSRGTDPTDDDTDGDGLADGLELRHPALEAADPLRKDVFVEVDWVRGERPSASTTDAVVEAYADAPVTNPDGTTGVALHVVYSNEVPYESTTDSESLEATMDRHMDFEDRGYHYALAVENVEGENTIGYTLIHEDNNPMAFKTDARAGYYYPDGAISNTFMHELGHALGLSNTAYEGIDSYDVPYSEYRSVMNYNSPTDALRYSTGPPFDDWDHLVERFDTPTVDP